MRLLGIDYGKKRVGIALSDENGAMAFPYATYPNHHDLLGRIMELCKEKNVGKIVIGKSHDLSDAPNPIQAGVEGLVEALRREQKVSVELEPEQYSTQAALRIQGHTKNTDASAAALILDAYITRQNQSREK